MKRFTFCPRMTIIRFDSRQKIAASILTKKLPPHNFALFACYEANMILPKYHNNKGGKTTAGDPILSPHTLLKKIRKNRKFPCIMKERFLSNSFWYIKGYLPSVSELVRIRDRLRHQAPAPALDPAPGEKVAFRVFFLQFCMCLRAYVCFVPNR